MPKSRLWIAVAVFIAATLFVSVTSLTTRISYAAPLEQLATAGPSPTAPATPTIPVGGFPTPELGEPGPQIILVMDVSGSMETHVLPEDVPEDVAELASRVKAVEEGEAVQEIDRQTEEMEKSPEVIAAISVVNESYIELEDYFSSHGMKSIQAVASRLEPTLVTAGCDPTYAYYMVIAADFAVIDEALPFLCTSLTEETTATIHEALAHIEDPEYAEIAQKYSEAVTAQDELLTTIGYYDLLQQKNNLLSSNEYLTALDQLEARAEELGYPTRLDLAKVAAKTLIDLSRLDDISSGTNTRIGVVAFSDGANLLMPLSNQFDTVDQVVQSLVTIGGTNIGGGLQVALDNFAATGDPDRPALIVLMSDGQPSSGMTSDQITAIVGPKLSDAEVEVCTAGFATSESEIDAELMQGIAAATDGEYGFARTGEELLGFFVKCRQSLLDEISSSLQGNVLQGEASAPQSIDIPENTGEMKVTLNWLQGDLEMVLIDPSGQEITEGTSGYTTQKEENLQLSLVTDPAPGTWSVQVRSTTSPEKGSLYNILVSLTERQLPTPTPTLQPSPSPSPTPAGFLGGGVLPYVLGGCVCLGLLLVLGGGAAALIFRRMRSQPDSTPPPSVTPTMAPSATHVDTTDQQPLPPQASIMQTYDANAATADISDAVAELAATVDAPAPTADIDPYLEPPIETEAMDAPFDPNVTAVAPKRQASPPEPPHPSGDPSQTIVSKPKQPKPPHPSGDPNETFVSRPKKDDDDDAG